MEAWWGQVRARCAAELREKEEKARIDREAAEREEDEAARRAASSIGDEEEDEEREAEAERKRDYAKEHGKPGWYTFRVSTLLSARSLCSRTIVWAGFGLCPRISISLP